MEKTPENPETRINAEGLEVRIENISPIDLDRAGVVLEICTEAKRLSAELVAFKEATRNLVFAFLDRVLNQYGTRLKTKKGNYDLISYCGLHRVTISVQDQKKLSPEFQAAIALLEECLLEWEEGSNAHLVKLVRAYYTPSQSGNVSISELRKLAKMEIADERWENIKKAIADSIQSNGPKEYLRLYSRKKTEDDWQQIQLNIAKL